MLPRNTVELQKDRAIPANTNIFDFEQKWLQEDNLPELMERILYSFEGSPFVIDIFEKAVPKKTGDVQEFTADYHRRAQREISSVLRERLSVTGDIPVHFSSMKMPNTDRFIVFFINKAADVDFDDIGDILDELHEITSKMDVDQKKRLIKCLMTLLMKISVFEKTEGMKHMEAHYYNEDLLLSPQFTVNEPEGCESKKVSQNSARKQKSSYVTALRPHLFYSDFDELVVDISTVNFEITGAKTGNDTGIKEYDSGGINSLITHKSKKYGVVRQCDATRVLRSFYNTGRYFGECRLYALTFLMDAIKARLGMAGIPVKQRIFSPTFEVDAFTRMNDDSRELSNITFLVKTVEPSKDDEEIFHDQVGYLAKKLNAEVITVEQFHNLRAEKNTQYNFIFLNPKTADGKFIQYTNTALEREIEAKNLADGKKRRMPEFNTTYQAYLQKQKDAEQQQESSFDIYTEIKIAIIESNLKRTPEKHCYQGFGLSTAHGLSVKKHRQLLEEANNTPASLINKDTGKSVREETLKKAEEQIKTFNLKIHKTATELSLKECVYSGKPLRLSTAGEFSDGNYSVSYIRHTRDQDNTVYFHGRVDFTIADGAISVDDILLQEAFHEVLEKHSPYLKLANKLYNNSFYLHCDTTGETLTSYNSGRIPRILGNADLDLVSRWINCHTDEEMKKAFAKKTGRDECILPYYLAKARGINNEFSDQHRQYHRIYIEENDHGVLCFVSDASSPKAKIAKQSLLKFIRCWDKNEVVMPWTSSQLVNDYLNSHTYDILSAKDSAKTSVFTKLAKILVMN